MDLLASSPHVHGKYDVSASTTNDALRLAFPESPVDSTLKLSASTTNGRAVVSLNPAYEGTFDLATTQYMPKLVRHDEVSDPSGRERQRRVEITSTDRRSVTGKATWSAKAGSGSVHVKTTNALVTLNL